MKQACFSIMRAKSMITGIKSHLGAMYLSSERRMMPMPWSSKLLICPTDRLHPISSSFCLPNRTRTRTKPSQTKPSQTKPSRAMNSTRKRRKPFGKGKPAEMVTELLRMIAIATMGNQNAPPVRQAFCINPFFLSFPFFPPCLLPFAALAAYYVPILFLPFLFPSLA